MGCRDDHRWTCFTPYFTLMSVAGEPSKMRINHGSARTRSAYRPSSSEDLRTADQRSVNQLRPHGIRWVSAEPAHPAGPRIGRQVGGFTRKTASQRARITMAAHRIRRRPRLARSINDRAGRQGPASCCGLAPRPRVLPRGRTHWVPPSGRCPFLRNDQSSRTLDQPGREPLLRPIRGL